MDNENPMMKKVLILGGSNFIGRHLVESLLDSDSYDITLYNRQKTNPELFPELKKVKGERQKMAISNLKGSDWDYVIDLSAYFPADLRDSLETLGEVGRYVFISTCSVYDMEDTSNRLKQEDAPIVKCTKAQEVDTGVQSYGARKAQCERILGESAYDYIILRPALVYGPYDQSDRLYYWLYQLKHKIGLPLPENGERLFSTCYIGDLISAIISAMHSEQGREVYNVVSQPANSIQEILNQAQAVLGLKRDFIDAPAAFLKEEGLREWFDIPLWINGDHFTFSNQKLIDKLGIGISPLKEALASSIDYYEKKAWPRPSYGIKEERLAALMHKLQA